MDDAFKKLNNRTALIVLEFFCGRPSRSFYVREAARESGVSTGACGSSLRLLAGMGFLNSRRHGNQVHYSLNALNPAVKQFRIFLNVLAMGEVVSAIKEDCERIVLYGSRAMGEEEEDSDFDLFVLTTEAEAVRKVLLQKKFDKVSAVVADAKRLMALRLKERPFYDRIMSGIELWRFLGRGKQ